MLDGLHVADSARRFERALRRALDRRFNRPRSNERDRRLSSRRDRVAYLDQLLSGETGPCAEQRCDAGLNHLR
jgi:hypothetical protein